MFLYVGGTPPFSVPASPTAYAGELSIEHPQPARAAPAPAPPALGAVPPQGIVAVVAEAVGSVNHLGLGRLGAGVDGAGDGDRISLASSDGNRSRSSSNAALIDGDGPGFLEKKSPATFPAVGGGVNVSEVIL